ncbi:MAG: hypothetical protein ATN31_10290 [Candidatus Epulonipiscioides saccharophilum]|nr:MAG: hypothetical protein ATN31_10290 [Epulopiscium sp. AS2M-Bin001]
MKNNTEYTEKILDSSAQEAVFNLREVIDNTTKDNAEDLKDLVRVLEKLFDNNKAIAQFLDIDKTIAHLLNISEDKVKKLSNRENAKLDAIMKKLFETSPRMFLGTIDNLYETNYRQQYLTGRLVDSDIKFLPTEFVRETFRFEMLKADISLQIKNNYYQIEIQTSHDNMAIRFARYGLEIGLKNCTTNPETGAWKIELPEQSVIYLENNQNNPKSNDYELWWRNEKLATIQVKDLKIWELDIDDMLDKKLYNLLPMSIFQYRIQLKKATSNKEKQKIKNEFLKKAKQILKKAKALSTKLVDGDIDLIITVLGELINYFDTRFFNGSIERLGEFKMTFTEEIQSYRTRINTAKAEGKAEGLAEGKAEGLAEGLEKGKAEGLAEGLEKGEATGEAKGRVNEKIEIAKNSLKKGFEIDVIMEITGLPEKELKKLQAEISQS